MNSRLLPSLPYPRLFAFLAFLYLLGAGQLRAQFYQGSFTGNGGSQTISLPGVTPTFVLVKSGSATIANNAVLGVNGLSSSVAMANTNTYTSAITAFGPNGFSVGSDAVANESGTTMHYLAVKNVVGSVKAGTYVGNGADNRNITGVGFQPDFVWIIAPGQTRIATSTYSGSVYRTVDMVGDASLGWTNSATADDVQALQADGFQVGASAMVNASGVTYGYLAVKNTSGFFKTLSWTGDSTDNRQLLGYGFAPDAVFSKNSSTTSTGGFKFDSTGRAVDTTLIPNATTAQANHIQQLLSDGIEVGTGTRANAVGGAYFGFAFKASVAVAPTPPSITASTANLAANATTVTIAGANFDPTPSANTVTFNNGAVGTVTSGSTSSLTVTFSTKPTSAGSLAATVTNGNGSSSSTQVATVIPVVTSSTANLASDATSLTINGFGFSTTPASNTVAFSPAGVGTVTASTNTSLTVTSVSGLTAGALNAVVTSNSQSSGAAVQVATVVVPAPTVTSINPASGSTAGGTSVTISGTGFTGATGATVGGVALSSFSVSNATTITGTTGVHAAGAVNVAITGSPGGASTGGTGIFTYVAPPTLSINDVTLSEGNSGTTNFTFTVSLSAPAGAGGVTFDIATADGTATQPADYTQRSLTAQTIASGDSSYTFTVAVNGDVAVETNETFFVNVTNVTGAIAADSQGQGSITNDDVAVAISSLTRVTGTPSNASSVSWTLTFASAVTGVTASNFSLTGAAAAGSSVGSPTTSNNIAWTIPVTTGSTDGALTLRVANATGLSSAISTGLPFDGDTITMDKTRPTVVSVVRQNPAGQNTTGNSVTFRVTYSESVTLAAPETGHFSLMSVNGGTVTGTIASVSGSGAARDVTVSITGGSGEFRLRVDN